MEENIEALIQRIDQYIVESQDENFDRYLEQMKQIVINDPSQASEIDRAVEHNIERYRKNVRKKQTSSLEFKIGAGVLSGVGILFVLIALVIMIRNFMPSFVQGILMLAFFALIWLISQLGISRLSKKLSLGISSAGITGLYLAAVLNYYYFDTLPRPAALAVLTGVAVISWLVGFLEKSMVLQCVSFGGGFLFALVLPWGGNTPEYIVSLVVLVALNLMWHMGAAGEHKRLLQFIHMICYVVYVVAYEALLCRNQPKQGLVCVLIYAMVAAFLLNLFYMKKKGAGCLVTWLCGCAYQTIFLGAVLYAMDLWQREGLTLVLLALPICNLIFLFLGKFQRQVQGIYYQSLLLAFLLIVEYQKFPLFLPAVVVSLVLMGIGLWKISEWKLANQLVCSGYIFLSMHLLVPQKGVGPAVVGALLAITLACLYVPSLRSKYERALVYTNISLIGIELLVQVNMINWGRTVGTYISYVLLLFLSAASVLLLWRKRCYLPENLRYLVLSLVLTYLVFILRIPLPIVVSISLMVLAVLSIVVGFLRWELPLRIFGLCLALFVCVKVLVYDFSELDLLGKSVLFLVVGLIAIAISLIYAVLEVKHRKNTKNPDF